MFNRDCTFNRDHRVVHENLSEELQEATLDDEAVHEENNSYKCQFCKTDFSTEDDMKKHTESVHKRKKTTRSNLLKNRVSKKKENVIIHFSKKDNMKKSDIDIQDEKVPFSCHLCGKNFDVKIYLYQPGLCYFS